jgi:hypothetical protein
MVAALKRSAAGVVKLAVSLTGITAPPTANQHHVEVHATAIAESEKHAV